MVGGFLVEGGEGDNGDNKIDAVALLSLQLCFDILTAGTTSLTLDWQRVVALPACGFGGWVYRARFSFSTVLLGDIT